MNIKPFFINSNICFEKTDISTYETFMNSIAGNIGNSYITYSLIKELFGGLKKIKHIQNIYNYNFDNQDIDIEYINNEATHVFLILQDQIRIQESYGFKLPYKKLERFILKLNKPVIIAGLGANSFNGFEHNFHKQLGANLINFLKFLSDHCIEIGIRGHFTEEVLHNIGIKNCNVIGCPSFYENGKSRTINKKNISNIKSILLTHPLTFNSENLNVILQDYQEEEIIKAIAFNRFSNNFSEKQRDLYCRQIYHIFSAIEDWKNFASRFNFSLGHRVHGSILSINSGVPSLCLNGDARAKEMCSLFKIPHIPNLKISNIEEIFNIYNHLDYTEMNNQYPVLYKNFSDFMFKNGITLFEDIPLNPEEYIKQPSLNLYTQNFYTNIDNLIFIKKELEKIKDDNILQKIFSVKNKGSHKVVTVFGLKLKFKRKFMPD